jgi:hypothetical protein
MSRRPRGKGNGTCWGGEECQNNEIPMEKVKKRGRLPSFWWVSGGEDWWAALKPETEIVIDAAGERVSVTVNSHGLGVTSVEDLS